MKNSALNEKHVQELADIDRSYQDEIQHLKREKVIFKIIQKRLDDAIFTLHLVLICFG